jgi:hypothetical protein
VSDKTYYCPKCGMKKLVRDSDYVVDSWCRIYRCTHNEEPKSWRGRQNYDAAKTPPCGLVIKGYNEDGSGRDATIDDFDQAHPLEGLSYAVVPEIQKWLLRHDHNVRKKSVDVVYEGQWIDAVRRSEGDGIGIELYWKRHTYEKDDQQLIDPLHYAFDALRSEAANHIEFQGFALSHLFTRHPVIWTKGESEDQAVFKDKSCGKRLREKVAALVDAMEDNFVELVASARREVARWKQEREAYEAALFDAAGDRITVRHYSGETLNATLAMDRVTPREVDRINNEFGLNIKLGATLGNCHSLEPLKLQELVDMIGAKEPIFDINRELKMEERWNDQARRWSLNEALRLARCLTQKTRRF